MVYAADIKNMNMLLCVAEVNSVLWVTRTTGIVVCFTRGVGTLESAIMKVPFAMCS